MFALVAWLLIVSLLTNHGACVNVNIMRGILLGAGYLVYRGWFALRQLPGRLLALLPGVDRERVGGDPLRYQDFVLYYRREVLLVEAGMVALAIMVVVMFEIVANRAHDAAEVTGIRPENMPQDLTPAR